jgi:hypothetical protein
VLSLDERLLRLEPSERRRRRSSGGRRGESVDEGTGFVEVILTLGESCSALLQSLTVCSGREGQLARSTAGSASLAARVRSYSPAVTLSLVCSLAILRSRSLVASVHFSALRTLSSRTPSTFEAGGGCSRAAALAVANVRASRYCFRRE